MAGDPRIFDERGRWKKGVSGNPGGRPRRTEWEKQLKTKFSIDKLSNMLLCLLSGIPIQPKDLKSLLKTIQDPEAKKEVRKYVKQLKGKTDIRCGQGGSLSSKDQLDLIKWLVEHTFGKAKQTVESDIKGDITTRNLKLEFIDSPNKDEE